MEYAISRGLGHCFDRSRLWQWLGHNHDLVREVLGEFATQHRNTSRKIQIRFDQGEFASAARLARRMEEIAGMLAADALAQAARTLRQKLQQNDSEQRRHALTNFHDALYALLHDIQRELCDESETV